MPALNLTGFVEYGTPVLGLWCEHCAMPSRVEVMVYLLGPALSVSTMGVASFCTEADHG